MSVTIKCNGVVTCQLQSLLPWLLWLKELMHNAAASHVLGISELPQTELVNNSFRGWHLSQAEVSGHSAAGSAAPCGLTALYLGVDFIPFIEKGIYWPTVPGILVNMSWSNHQKFSSPNGYFPTCDRLPHHSVQLKTFSSKQLTISSSFFSAVQIIVIVKVSVSKRSTR